MQNRIAAFLTTGFILCAAMISLANETSKNPAQLESFEFVVELGESGTSFEAHHGTNWLNLNWGASGGSESSFWLNESGVAARESDMTGHKFLVHVKTTPGKIELESKHGTSWKELSYSSTELRRVVVNENGIQKEVVKR
jgi:hypothetical protein